VAIFLLVFATILLSMHRLIACALLVAALSLSSCAVPLGPGFHTEKELLEVRFVPGSAPHLEVHATFTLKNSGNAPLDSLEISLPDEKDFGRSNLRITVDGVAVSPQPLAGPASASEPAAAPESSVRIAFPSPWPQNARRTLVVACDLSRTSERGTPLALSDTSFYLPDGAWYPLLRAPKGLFARGDAPPLRFDFSVYVPDGFLVHAAGQSNGKRRRDGESEFRFRITTDDFSPFVVAGRYHEQQFKDSAGTVLCWTFQPLPADHVARASPRLTAAMKINDSVFGPRAGSPRTIRLVELTSADPGPWLGRAFPDGILLWGDVFRKDSFDEVATLQMARLWFGQSLTPRRETRLLFDPAAATYASILVSEAREGASVRRRHAAALIEQYQKSLNGREEKSLTGDFGKNPDVLLEVPSGTVSLETAQRDAAIAKGALFFLALEDEYGKQIVHRALARMIRALRGREAGIFELRAALEAESGKGLGEFFRAWLNQPGIPPSFRARYASENRKSKNELH
jgi:hypothetical protein